MKNNSFVNPAFCQQSEFYPNTSVGHQSTGSQFIRKASSSFKVNRSDSINSIGGNYQKRNYNKSLLSLNSSVSAGPPRSGPKPNDGYSGVNNNSGRYAIVPIEDLPCDNDRSYKIVSDNFVKSQHNLDCFSSLPPTINNHSESDNMDKNYSSLVYESELNNQKTPPPRLYNAFSSDFGATSFVIMDKKKVQRYDVIPTDDDEEIVDDNQEIIQMHNGRAHRYAIIHAEEEGEEDEENDTDGDNDEGNVEASQPKPQQIQSKNNHHHNYATIREPNQHKMMQQSTPKKQMYPASKSQQIRQSFITPTKNIATQKLHELLSTPNKSQHSIINQSSPIKYYSTPNRAYLQPPASLPPAVPSVQIIQQQTPPSAGSKQYEFMPQKLKYDHYPVKQQYVSNGGGGGVVHKGGGVGSTTKINAALNERRTTAVITPRLLMSQSNRVLNMNQNGYDDELGEGLKHLEHLEELPQKMSNAFLTISIISAILFICGALNTGLVVYLIYNYGKSLFMEVALTSAIAAIFLGIQGFKSRKHVQLPNRNYISGYLVINIFSLLKCCALLVLLVLEPFPGSPLHDVTSGVILGLSTLTLLLISLGIIISKWCTLTPPDNRVDLYT